MLADALSGDPANDSRTGRGAATFAANVGLTGQERDDMGPRAKLLRLSENAASAQEIQHFAEW